MSGDDAKWCFSIHLLGLHLDLVWRTSRRRLGLSRTAAMA